MTQSGINLSSLNYEQPADLVSSMEANIKEDTADKQAYFQNLITQHNELEKIKNSKYKALYDLTSEGAKLGKVIWEEKQVREIIDDWNTTNQEYNTRNRGALQKTEEWEDKRNQVQGEQNAFIQNADAEQVDQVTQIAGIRKPYDGKISTLRNQGRDYLPFYFTAAQNLEVQLPDGTWSTLALTNNSDDRAYIEGAIRKTWLMQAVGSKGDPVSNHLIRRHLYPAMVKVEQMAYTKWAQAKVTGVQSAAKQDDKIKMFEQANSEDPNISGAAILDHAARNLGNPKFGGNRGLARKASTDLYIEGIEDGYITDIDKIGDYEFTPDGWPEGKTVKFRDHFPKEWKRITAAKNLKSANNMRDMENELKGKGDLWVQQKLEKYLGKDAEPFTLEARNTIAKEFRDEFGPNVPLPKPLSTLSTKLEADDELTYMGLEAKAARQEIITAEDYAGITDPVWLEKAKALSERTVNNMNPSEAYDAFNMAYDIISGNAANVAKFEGKPLEKREYAKRISGEIAKQFAKEKKITPNDPAAAMAAAVENVRSREKAGEFDFAPGTILGSTRSEKSTSSDALLTGQALLGAKNSGKIRVWEDPVRLAGETEQRVDEGIRFYKALKNGDKVRMPAYWRKVAQSSGLDPKQYLEARLKAMGIIDDKGIEQTGWEKEVQNLSRIDQKGLTIKPTDGKTYTIASKDASWMIKSLREQDYGTINKDGALDENVDVSKMTVRQVLELTNQGYGGIGAFKLTREGLLQSVAGTSIGFDDVFDENTQNLLLLGRLRYKANRRQGNRGALQQDYRRLVNLKPEEIEFFKKIEPGLSEMNQPQNLLPALAGNY